MTPIPATPYNLLGMRSLALHKQGKTWKAIADLLSEDPTQVYCAARRMAVRLARITHEPVKSAGSKPQQAFTRMICAHGYTVRSLCAETGIPEHAVYDWMRGKCKASFPMVCRVADTLRVTVQVVLATLPEGQLLDVAPTPTRKVEGPRSTEPKGKQAYDLYVAGHRWIDISRMLDLPVSAADTYARGYARSRDLPWPPERVKVPIVPPSKGQQAYHLRRRGEEWSAIAVKIGITKGHPHNHARNYAHRHNLPWPPPLKLPTVKVTQ